MITLHPSVLYLTSKVVKISLFPLKLRISQILPVILRSCHSVLLFAPSTLNMVIFEFSIRLFQQVQKLFCGSQKSYFIAPGSLPHFFRNWTTIKLAVTPLVKNLLKFTILRCFEVCKRSIWSSQ